MNVRLVVVVVVSGCQVYDFQEVHPIAVAQQVKEVDVTAQPLKPNLFLVVDKSGSMSGPVEPTCTGASCQSRIAALQQAMDTFLTQAGSSVHLGMVSFPSNNTCGLGDLAKAVPLDEGDDDDTRLGQAATLVKSQIDLLVPGGGTPTGATLHALKDYGPLHARDRANYAVLLTDGAPNCNPDLDANTCTCTTSGATPCSSLGNNLCLDDTGTAAEVALLRDQGIKTIVVGFGADVAGASGASVLSTFAAAGGFSRPCTTDADCGAGDTCNSGGVDQCGRPASTCGHPFFQAGNAGELGKVLDAIQKSIQCPVCNLVLNTVPTDPRLITVLVDGQALPQGPDTWAYRPGELTAAIEFLGATCQELEQSTPAKPVHIEVRVVEPL
jgi:hypothetical protein